MAGNNSIQILRGNNVKSTAADKILLDGQPLYDRTTGYLYVGENNTVANTQAVNAHYANSAGIAHELSNGLYFNGSGSSVRWDGSDDKVVYAPTSFGTSGQVWGMTSSRRVGWMDQTEIPGTIEHANTANVAYEVSGSNVAGAVANANYSKVAGKVDSMLSLRVAGKGYGFDGFASVNIMDRNLVATNTTLDRGAIPYVSTNGTTSTPANFSWLAKGDDGQVLTATSTGIAWTSPRVLYCIEWSGVMMAIFSGSPGITSAQDIYDGLQSSKVSNQIFGFSIVDGVAERPLTKILTSPDQLLFVTQGTQPTVIVPITETESVSIFPLYEFIG